MVEIANRIISMIGLLSYKRVAFFIFYFLLIYNNVKEIPLSYCVEKIYTYMDSASGGARNEGTV